jgi:hypothetical protein
MARRQKKADRAEAAEPLYSGLRLVEGPKKEPQPAFKTVFAVEAEAAVQAKESMMRLFRVELADKALFIVAKSRRVAAETALAEFGGRITPVKQTKRDAIAKRLQKLTMEDKSVLIRELQAMIDAQKK